MTALHLLYSIVLERAFALWSLGYMGVLSSIHCNRTAARPAFAVLGTETQCRDTNQHDVHSVPGSLGPKGNLRKFSLLPIFIPFLPSGTFLSSPFGRFSQKVAIEDLSLLSQLKDAFRKPLVEIIYCKKVNDRSLYCYIQDKKGK